MAEKNQKIRKSRSREIFEQAENAGRFAGNDHDSNEARQMASDNIANEEHGAGNTHKGDNARRNPPKGQDSKGEAQNINDDTGRPLNEDETEHARNKAMEGASQDRDVHQSGPGSKAFK